MNQYVTGGIIRKLREERKITQARFAEMLNVSGKTVSKWETGRGYADITLIEPIANALGISVIELLSGENITNGNRPFNMLKSKFYVCPICGNIITSTGESVISCCGITLMPLEAEDPDEGHILSVEKSEDEFYVTLNHEMTKEHYISFIAALSDNGIQLVKLYPEGNAEARFKISRTRAIYYFCNRNGLFKATKW
ncbi:MAG TPA: XRE family transcriptional regulator [Eubacteriaceae bacterium]|nr:XRE family transcriptional regulator [Eubacteriaceae bacterium]